MEIKMQTSRVQSKKHFTTMDFNQSGFKIKDGKIKLSHSYNNIPLEFGLPEKFGFGSLFTR
jgi:putative transposase